MEDTSRLIKTPQIKGLNLTRIKEKNEDRKEGKTIEENGERRSYRLLRMKLRFCLLSLSRLYSTVQCRCSLPLPVPYLGSDVRYYDYPKPLQKSYLFRPRHYVRPYVYLYVRFVLRRFWCRFSSPFFQLYRDPKSLKLNSLPLLLLLLLPLLLLLLYLLSLTFVFRFIILVFTNLLCFH